MHSMREQYPPLANSMTIRQLYESTVDSRRAVFSIGTFFAF